MVTARRSNASARTDSLIFIQVISHGFYTPLCLSASIVFPPHITRASVLPERDETCMPQVIVPSSSKESPTVLVPGRQRGPVGQVSGR